MPKAPSSASAYCSDSPSPKRRPAPPRGGSESDFGRHGPQFGTRLLGPTLQLILLGRTDRMAH
jgi:hypothetical protein